MLTLKSSLFNLPNDVKPNTDFLTVSIEIVHRTLFCFLFRFYDFVLIKLRRQKCQLFPIAKNFHKYIQIIHYLIESSVDKSLQ